MTNPREDIIELLSFFADGYSVESRHIVDGTKVCEIVDHLMANGVTVQEWISVEAGELQNYIGVPVCIKRKTDGECWWAIIRGIKGDKVSTDYGGYFKLSEYGETWIVKYLPLPQPPKGE